MNPIAVNSINIINFGFKATFDILNRRIRFSIADLTTFNGGGENNVQGVCLEVIDPSGVIINAIDFTAPDIDCSSATTFNLPLPNGDGIFGSWQIRAQIKEADGTIYTATVPPKEICKPIGLVDDVVPGTLVIKVDCSVPYIQVSETTLLTYKNLSPLSKTKAGVLYYPRGTVGDMAFTTTPIQDNRLYTGEYVARCRTIATYDMGDYVFVEVTYDSTQKEDVTCKSKICDIACCLEELYAKWQANCGNAKGAEAKEKLDKITVPLFVATSKEKCGKSAGEQIKQIKEILDCDCNCAGQQVETAPIQLGGGGAVILDGQCATTVTADAPVGSSITYHAKTKAVSVVKGDTGDLAYSITKVETDCDIKYALAFDYDGLAGSILTAIANNSVRQDFLNTLIYNIGAGVVLTGLDGKCVINLTTCDYLLQKSIVSTINIFSVIINSTVYLAPGALLVSDAAGISTWLNGLGKGTFVVTSVPSGDNSVLTITSTANTNVVNSIGYIDPANPDGNKKLINFAKTCNSLKQILQAIINYLCALDATQIKIGAEIDFCKLNDAGTAKEVMTVAADVLLSDFLAEWNAAWCVLIDKLLAVTTVNCAIMKELFPVDTVNAMSAGDGIYMVKNGNCVRVLPKELALFIFGLAKTDAQVKAMFCSIDCSSQATGCPDITDFVDETGTGDDGQEITVPSATYSIAQTLHQFLTIKHRLFGSTEWVVDTTTAEAYANGNLVTPYVIDGLAEGAAYEVNVQVTPSATCNPSGVTKEITTDVVSETSIVTFMNEFDDEEFATADLVITSIKFNAGANILGAPLSVGEHFTYDFSGLGAGPFLIKMTFGSVINPSKLFTALMRGATQIVGTYFNYTTGEATIYASVTPLSGDVILVRNTNEYKKPENYTINEGVINPACSLPSFAISRNAIAAADATANADAVDVLITWTASNGGTGTNTVTFAAGDTNKTGSHGNIGSGVCTYVNGVVTSIT